jgi:F5/8 type C domain/Fibrinogen beta and gamma chains, C-terminal globular domain
MKNVLLFILLVFVIEIKAQTSTNSTGSGNFNATATWTSPKDLTGTANILNGHTVTIPAYNVVYSNKITFAGNAKLSFDGPTSKWIPASVLNASPATESINNSSNWYATSVWAGNGYGVEHYTPWIDSGQGWSASSAFNGTDYLQYDLRGPKWIQGIVTQGRANMDQWVTSAKIEVSPDFTNWVTVYSSRALNTDRNTKVSVSFPQVMFARYVRVTPTGVANHASMRLGILLRDNGFKSCKEILTTFPNSSSGVYTIDPDGSTGALPSTSCYCDMTTDGGGWTLVLNYLHAANANPALSVKTNSLPLLGSTILGTDESGSSTTWGHVAPSYLTSFSFTELRFYGKTSGHARVINFKTTHAGTINYFKTGLGTASGIQTGFTPLSGHNSFLPASANLFFTNEANNSMTNFPMYLGGTYHWGIRGHDFRWEVDDFPANVGTGYQNNTHHQIWIR